MTPYFSDEHLTVYHGDSREVMAQMEPESVHCVVTSPPYWGLRDYGEVGQLGLEPTPEEYVANMVAVFREVRRVLRADGTVWLNLGDSYANNPASGGPGQQDGGDHQRTPRRVYVRPSGLKPKDLVGIPWRVAFALQADGWYLRSDIIWAKPNPMPESVTDRPTKSHEYIFLLSKSPRYYFDADAVREPHSREWALESVGPGYMTPQQGRNDGGKRQGTEQNPAGRNIRSVWTIATAPYPGAHFATFPPKLVEPCIKAGTSEKGVCPECGAPWERVVERGNSEHHHRAGCGHVDIGSADFYDGGKYGGFQNTARATETWRPSCAHAADPVPATILDMFAGSGTTGMVAASLGRRAVLIDLSMDYLGQLMERNAQKPLGLLA